MRHEYSSKPVTPWGGMKEMKAVIDKTGIVEKMKELGLPEGTSNNVISGSCVITSFWVSVWIGCYKFSHTAVVRLDEVLKKVFNWERVPSGTTYTRYFRRFSKDSSKVFFKPLFQWFFTQLNFDNFTLDVDSSVMTRYGVQQGAKKGYNPTKRGRASHHPLFAFVSELRMVANCWNRSGDSSSASKCVSFLKETFEILKNKKIGLFRADSGFCNEDILSYLEERGVNTPYVIACRLYANIQLAIYQTQNWLPLSTGLWVSEMSLQLGGWHRTRRIIIIKQDEELRAKATGKKLKTLFDNDPHFKQKKLYSTRYHVMVTNQKLPAEQIWEQYKGRADCENRIKELKADFGTNSFNLDDFWATQAAMSMSIMAYNLMSLFRIMTHQKNPTPTLKTLRFNCFAVGSWIVKKGRHSLLKMSVPLERRQWYDGLFSSIDDSQLPLSLKT